MTEISIPRPGKRFKIAILIIVIALMAGYIANNEYTKATYQAYLDGVTDGRIDVFNIAYNSPLGFVKMENVTLHTPNGCSLVR